MAIGKVIGGYLLVGLLCVPLVYWNSANGYRSGETARNVGQALSGGLLFWPSYVFSIEPEIDGDSIEGFGKSYREVLDYRNTKWFAGGSDRSRKSENRHMMDSALTACILMLDTERRIPKGVDVWAWMSSSTDPYVRAVQKKVIDKFDGEDFSGINSVGRECFKKQ